MESILIDKALELPPNERVAFAELILANIDHEDEKIRKIWIAEVRERMQDTKNGGAKLLDFEKLYNES